MTVLATLLDWPFLLFVVVVAFIARFHRQIGALLERGDIAISWGPDRSIRLRDLSDSLDQELDPIRERLDALEAQQSPMVMTAGVAASADQADTPEATQRLRAALTDTPYRWRSLPRLSALSGLSEDDALRILRKDPEVALSVGKTGNRIARLKSE